VTGLSMAFSVGDKLILHTGFDLSSLIDNLSTDQAIGYFW
jgi:hypothetical protein